MVNKKGQTAMEFLMTYGWAILVAIVVIAVLAIFFRPGYVVNDEQFVIYENFCHIENIPVGEACYGLTNHSCGKGTKYEDWIASNYYEKDKCAIDFVPTELLDLCVDSNAVSCSLLDFEVRKVENYTYLSKGCLTLSKETEVCKHNQTNYLVDDEYKSIWIQHELTRNFLNKYAECNRYNPSDISQCTQWIYGNYTIEVKP